MVIENIAVVEHSTIMFLRESVKYEESSENRNLGDVKLRLIKVNAERCIEKIK